MGNTHTDSQEEWTVAFWLDPISSPHHSLLRPPWPGPHSPAALGNGGHDLMAGTERLGPGLHAGMPQQMRGLLMPGAQYRLRLGTKGPAEWHAGQRGGRGIRNK